MKQLILIAGMLLAMTAKLAAQDNKGIEVKGFQTHNTGLLNENHQFEIVAHEDVDVNLNLKLKTEDNLNVIVTDKRNNTILSKKFKNAGSNKLNFTMEEDEKYLVTVLGEKQSNMVVQVSED